MTQTSTRSSLHRANNFPWAPVLLVVAIAAALVMGRLMPLPWPGLQDSPAHWVGLGFGAAGLLLIVLATVTLVQHRTTILPDKAATTLVVSGPYRRFRNPIYLGEVLMLFAAAEVTKSIWFVAAGLGFGLLVTLFQIIPEERHLEACFGDTYRDYKARTRRWI
jgi:protein-S-isoprenylcysteine O-methyltransferase Ste14